MKSTKKELTIEEKLQLLLKSEWDYKDISKYFSCGSTKAIEIKKEARIHNGGHPKYRKELVNIDAVFEVLGINLASELSRIKSIKEIFDSDLLVGVA